MYTHNCCSYDKRRTIYQEILTKGKFDKFDESGSNSQNQESIIERERRRAIACTNRLSEVVM